MFLHVLDIICMMVSKDECDVFIFWKIFEISKNHWDSQLDPFKKCLHKYWYPQLSSLHACFPQSLVYLLRNMVFLHVRFCSITRQTITFWVSMCRRKYRTIMYLGRDLFRELNRIVSYLLSICICSHKINSTSIYYLINAGNIHRLKIGWMLTWVL